jgi:ferredoxin
MAIFSVFIDDGCITCDACEEAAPDIFEVTEDTCFIKPDARLDGGYDRNIAKSGLKPDVVSSLSDDIFDAADACPVDVIIVVEGTGEEAPEPEEEADPEPEEEIVSEESEEITGDDLESLLTAGDRKMSILFGSQSGNSEELAAKFAKRATDYGLDATVHDMDGFDLPSLSLCV